MVVDLATYKQERLQERAESLGQMSASTRSGHLLAVLAKARLAQAELRTAQQIEHAGLVLTVLSEATGEASAALTVDALDVAVDALCNAKQAEAARDLAKETIETHSELVPRNGTWLPIPLFRAPRTLLAVQAARILAQAIELAGDPDDGLHRLIALDKLLSRNPSLGPPSRIAQERVRVLRAVLCAARRDGSAPAVRFANLARTTGDELAVAIEPINPAAASGYWHRAACELRNRSKGRQHAEEATQLFRRSLPLRPQSRRYESTRGMVTGDLLVLQGHRALGARVLTETVARLAPDLPRHFESARALLIERDLLVADLI